MLKINNITLQNFMSVGAVPITIDLSSYNKTLVTGINAAGKSSTLLDSVVFALYGTAYRNINKNQLINTINESGLLVSIEFSIYTNNYKVVRGVQPAIFDIYVNGTKTNELSSIKEQQRFLEEEILKINYLTFSNIAILGSANYIPFMDQPLATRRTLVEELLDINLFSQMLGLAKDSSRELVDNIKQLMSDIKSLKEQISLVESFIYTITNKVDEVDNTERITELTEKLHNINGEIEKANASKLLYQEQLSKLENPQQHITKVQSFVSTFESQVKIENKKLKFYQANDSCPTCTQPIEVNFKDNAIKESDVLVAELQNKIIKAKSLLDNKYKILSIIDTLNTNIKNIDYDIRNYNRVVSDVNQQLKILAKKPQQKSNIGDLDSYRKKLVDFNASLAESYAKLEILKSEKLDYDIVIKLLSDSGIKTKILEKYLPYFNSYINKYLSIFGLNINFNFNSLFKEVIKCRYKDTFTYNSFSEGEKMKISLSIMLAFRDLASLKSTNSTNLLIMDEIFDSSLDFDSNQNLMTILNGMVDNNIFTITHRNDVNAEDFDRTMVFSKVNSFTKIDYI
jgi:DNA repair exonuclease SbcCD ATPase subunit